MSPYLVEQELESVWLSNVDAEKKNLNLYNSTKYS